MMRSRWTADAKDDLAKIKTFIADDSRENAKRFIQRIRAAVKAIRFPEAGSRILQFDKADLREIYVGNYRVVYRVVKSEIWVYRVIHGARRLPDSLGQL